MLRTKRCLSLYRNEVQYNGIEMCIKGEKMLKNIVMSSLLATALLFSGCGDNEAEGVVQVQQDLDKGNYEAIIAKYEGLASTNEEYMALAAAYMQRAGLGLADLMVVIADSSDDEDSDAFAAFVKSVKTSSSRTALRDLEKSSLNYKEVVADCTALDLSSSEEDACLYRGLAQTLKAASTIGYIADNLESFGSDGSVEADAKLTSTACAMEYALGNSIQNTTDCTLTSGPTDITFDSNITYSSIKITVNAEEFEHLIRDINGTNYTAITDGFCTIDDFATRVDTKPTTGDYHVCPVTESAEDDEITTEGLIVDALNDGVEAISGVATDEMQGDIDEFKCEVLGGTYTSYGESGSCTENLASDVTTQQVIDYLETNN